GLERDGGWPPSARRRALDHRGTLSAMASEGYRVAVVGATGQVGTLMLQLLRERRFSASEIVPFASNRSAGRELGEGLVVRALDDDAIEGFDLAIFSAGGGTSGDWAPRFAAAGALVIDNSSRWRMHDDVPLVVSEVNPAALDALAADGAHRGIVANPNCSTMQMVVALKPLYDAAGIERLVISTYQAVSGTGRRAVDELLDQAHAILHERDIEAPEQYAHQIAFNALPHAGKFADGDDHTDEERKLMNETRKILGDSSIRVSATCVRVPVVTGHSEAVNVQTRDPLAPDEARALLRRAAGGTVVDDPGPEPVRANALPAASRAPLRQARCHGRTRAGTIEVLRHDRHTGAAHTRQVGARDLGRAERSRSPRTPSRPRRGDPDHARAAGGE